MSAADLMLRRRQLVRDARAAHEAMLARWTSELHPSLLRDIADWKVEA